MSYKYYGNCQEFRVPPSLSEYNTSMVIEEIPCKNIKDPNIWGPLAWFFLFAGSCSASDTISRADAQKYWHFIEGLPLMLPCSVCKGHASEYVRISRPFKNIICSSRKNLVKFFVDFHNMIGQKKGQKKLSLRDVEDRFMRDGPINAFRIKYN